MSSVILRGALHRARQEEWEAMQRRLAHGQGVVKSVVGNMRDIHHHAELVHARDGLAAQGRKPFPLRLVAGGIAQLVILGVGQRHVADAQAIEDVEHAQIAFNLVAPLRLP